MRLIRWFKPAGYALAMVCVAASLHAQTASSTITLDEAIQRAQHANSAYASAVTDAGVARADAVIARSALLPGIVYHNQFLYTQGQPSNSAASTTPSSTGTTTSSVRFIANNTIHEYTSQGIVTETIGGQTITAYRRALVDATTAAARLEVARRGLVATVVQAYYGLLNADQKVLIAQRALDEADRFSNNSRQREQAGEAARADVVKGNLLQQQRQRDLNDAEIADNKARFGLAVFLFTDPTTPFQLATNLDTLPPLPDRSAVEAAARAKNPDLRSALTALKSAKLDVTGAKFGYLPDLSVQAFYGIDAPQFASSSVIDGITTRNLGYAAAATLDIPIFDWFATHQKIKQSEIRRSQAEVELTVTQRQLIASLNELYIEASVQQKQLTLLDLSVNTAAESLRLTNLRYSGGEGSVLEVVDAQNSLVSAEQARADGATAYFTVLANLQTLTGNLP